MLRWVRVQGLGWDTFNILALQGFELLAAQSLLTYMADAGTEPFVVVACFAPPDLLKNLRTTRHASCHSTV